MRERNLFVFARTVPYPASASLGNTIFSAIRNSSAFYFSGAEPWDWTLPQNADLWRDGVKTIFDPCPAGWRVPKNGEGEFSPLNALTQENGPWIMQNGDAGHLFGPAAVHSGSAWYTACGWRGYTDGKINFVLQHADIWFSTVSGTGSYNLYSVAEGVFPTANAVRAYGFPVRCVRE